MIWLILKTLFNIVPMLVQMYRDGKLKEGSYAEVEHEVHDRAWAAMVARMEELDQNEDDDPNNRARPSFDGMHDGDSAKPKPTSVG